LHVARPPRLLIVSPSYAGFSPGFLTSMLSTSEALRARKLSFGFHCMYHAEIALARAFLVHEFRMHEFTRGPWTHMLMVDSDIGWQPETLVQMLDRNVDFIVAAPPQKKLEPSFAVFPEMPFGVAIDEIEVDGTIQVLAAGIAFALIRHTVIERLTVAHPELRCSDGRYALFDPIIAAGRRMSEDISFCFRWRALGGQIWLLKDAPLQHHGPFTFAGNYADTLRTAPFAMPPRGAVATSADQRPPVGGNDPCPCGSGRTWKQCHGAGAEV